LNAILAAFPIHEQIGFKGGLGLQKKDPGSIFTKLFSVFKGRLSEEESRQKDIFLVVKPFCFNKC
jgi:hypothetical protein